MPPPQRLRPVASLPFAGPWRRALHVDPAGGAPRAVVLAFAPPELADDPARLARLVRDAEAAARIRHASLVPALGLETVGDAVALAAEHVDGVILAALLAAGGRLPPDVAARIACDAAAGVAALHAADAGDGQPLAHGALSAAWISVGADGVTRVAGAGAGSGTPADDVRALAAVLHLCLTGEPPADPPRPLDAAGVPPALAAVVDAALADRTAAPGAAAALAAAIAGAIPLAPAEHVAAYVEAIVPADDPERLALARKLAEAIEDARASEVEDDALIVSAEVEVPAWAVAGVVGGAAAGGAALATASPTATTTATPTATATPIATATATAIATPNATATSAHAERSVRAADSQSKGTPTEPPARPSPDVAITFPVPPPPAPRSRLPLLAGLVLAALGFGLGLGLSQRLPLPGFLSRSASPDARAARADAPPAAPDAAPVPPSPPAPVPAPAAVAAAAAPAESSTRPAAPPRPPAPPSLAITAEPPVDVYVDGKKAGKPPLTVPVAAGDHDVRLHDPAQGVDARRRVSVRGPSTPVRFALRRGTLAVTAPPDTEVLVDGRRAGKGDVRVELWEGNHRVEARRGDAKVSEKFTLHGGETWTYDVTPTGN